MVEGGPCEAWWKGPSHGTSKNPPRDSLSITGPPPPPPNSAFAEFGIYDYPSRVNPTWVAVPLPRSAGNESGSCFTQPPALTCHVRRVEASKISALPNCNFASILFAHSRRAAQVGRCRDFSTGVQGSDGFEQGRPGVQRRAERMVLVCAPSLGPRVEVHTVSCCRWGVE
jgi:hypothetical protein